jgi:hypothetical protein
MGRQIEAFNKNAFKRNSSAFVRAAYARPFGDGKASQRTFFKEKFFALARKID